MIIIQFINYAIKLLIAPFLVNLVSNDVSALLSGGLGKLVLYTSILIVTVIVAIVLKFLVERNRTPHSQISLPTSVDVQSLRQKLTELSQLPASWRHDMESFRDSMSRQLDDKLNEFKEVALRESRREYVQPLRNGVRELSLSSSGGVGSLRVGVSQQLEEQMNGIQSRFEKKIEEKMKQIQLNCEAQIEEKMKQAQLNFEKTLFQTFAHSSQLQSENLVLSYDTKQDVDDVSNEQVKKEFKADLEAHGSTVLYKRISLMHHDAEVELGHVPSQIMRSMQLAYRIDKDCTLQFGSTAVMKYTEAGLRVWMLPEDSTPAIISYRRSPWTLSDLLPGRLAMWTIKGYNLQKSTLRASTTEKSEIFKILYQYQTNSGVDVVICEDPCLVQKSAPMFHKKIHIIASKLVEVEQGLTLKVQSEPKSVQEAYWTAVKDGLTPYLRNVILITIMIDIHFLLSKYWNQWRYLGLLLGHASTNVDVNFEDNSVHSNLSSNNYLCKIFLFYQFVIVISEIVSILWLHLQETFPQLGAVTVVLASTMIFVREEGRKFLPNPRPRPVGAMPPPGTEKLNDSVWELYSHDSHPEVEIIFFHGLQLGDLEDAFWKTWLGANRDDHEKVVWPQTWLSQKFPRARIISISYDSSARELDGENNVSKLGENLVSDMILDPKCNIGQNCPVFLVGHSLGGIVIKEFILSAIRKKSLLSSENYDEKISRLNTFLDDSNEGVLKEIVLSAVIERKNSFKSRNRERYQRDVSRINTFLENCRGSFFYATPHLDSRMTELLRLVDPHTTSPILELLKTFQNRTARINEEFKQQRSLTPLNMKTFGMAEGRKTSYKAFYDTVVGEESAQYEMDESHTETTSDHFSVCTAESPNSPVIAILVQFIENIFPQITSSNLYPHHHPRQWQQSRGFRYLGQRLATWVMKVITG